jgi:hypothetical protein
MAEVSATPIGYLSWLLVTARFAASLATYFVVNTLSFAMIAAASHFWAGPD